MWGLNIGEFSSVLRVCSGRISTRPGSSPPNLPKIVLLSLPDKSTNAADWYWQNMDTHLDLG